MNQKEEGREDFSLTIVFQRKTFSGGTGRGEKEEGGSGSGPASAPHQQADADSAAAQPTIAAAAVNGTIREPFSPTEKDPVPRRILHGKRVILRKKVRKQNRTVIRKGGGTELANVATMTTTTTIDKRGIKIKKKIEIGVGSGREWS